MDKQNTDVTVFFNIKYPAFIKTHILTAAKKG